VLAEIVDDIDALAVFVRAFVGSADGSLELRRSHTGPAVEAHDVGRRFANLLLAELPPGATGEPPDPGGAPAAYVTRHDLPENDTIEKETAQ
jgi:hydroxymethylbilane synthase